MISAISGIRPNSDLQIRKLFTERVAPRRGVPICLSTSTMSSRGWFLGYSVRLQRAE
jgi:hypothetical protein